MQTEGRQAVSATGSQLHSDKLDYRVFSILLEEARFSLVAGKKKIEASLASEILCWHMAMDGSLSTTGFGLLFY